MPQFTQHIKVLHVSCAHLNNIHLVKQVDVLQAGQFGDDGQAGFFFRFQQQLDSLRLESAERVRRGSWLKRAAPQQGSARRFHPLCCFNDLFRRFHRTGPCNDCEARSADFGVPDWNYTVLRMKFSVYQLVGF